MRRFFTRGVHLMVAALLAGVSMASAQETPDPRATAQMHLGPFYLTPRLVVKEFGVDSNVFNEPDAKQDFTFTLAPHADVWLPFGTRALLTTSITTDLVYYQQYASERSINPAVRIRGDAFLGRLAPFAAATYLNSRQRVNYEIDVRSEREERMLRAGTNVRLTQRLAVELAASRSDVRYDAAATFHDIQLRDTLNRDTEGVSVVARHAITPLTTLVLEADRSSDRFPFSPLRDSDSTRLAPGVEFKPLALISGSGSVGVRRFSPRNPSLEEFTGLVANGTLSYTLLGTTRFTVDVERDLTYSYERVQPYFLVEGYGLTVRRQIVGRTDVTGAVHRFKHSYRDLLLPGAIPSDMGRVDVTRAWMGSFGYRLGQNTRAGVGVQYTERESNRARFRNYEGLRFITTIDYEL